MGANPAIGIALRLDAPACSEINLNGPGTTRCIEVRIRPGRRQCGRPIQAAMRTLDASLSQLQRFACPGEIAPLARCDGNAGDVNPARTALDIRQLQRDPLRDETVQGDPFDVEAQTGMHQRRSAQQAHANAAAPACGLTHDGVQAGKTPVER